jgi:hypothetical protein
MMPLDSNCMSGAARRVPCGEVEMVAEAVHVTG